MVFLKSNLARTVITALLATVGLASTASTASAATSTFKVLLDLDNNAATGCTVSTVSGSFAGVEQSLITTVTVTGITAQVTAVQVESCVSGSTFSAPVPITPPAGHPLPWPVGSTNGTGGSSVIETFFPLSLATVQPVHTVRLAVVAYDVSPVPAGTLPQDSLTATTGGAPILLQAAGIEDIPTLSEWGLLFLGLLLAASAVALLRRRTAAAFLVAFLLLTGAGVAWAAAFDFDGTTTGEWGAGTLLAVDGVDVPPAPVGADIVAVYGSRTRPRSTSGSTPTSSRRTSRRSSTAPPSRSRRTARTAPRWERR